MHTEFITLTIIASFFLLVILGLAVMLYFRSKDLDEAGEAIEAALEIIEKQQQTIAENLAQQSNAGPQAFQNIINDIISVSYPPINQPDKQECNCPMCLLRKAKSELKEAETAEEYERCKLLQKEINRMGEYFKRGYEYSQSHQ